MCGVKVTAANLPTGWKKRIVSRRVSGSDGLGGCLGRGGCARGRLEPCGQERCRQREQIPAFRTGKQRLCWGVPPNFVLSLPI